MRIKMKRLQRKYADVNISEIEKALVYSYLARKGISYKGDMYFEGYFENWGKEKTELLKYVEDNFEHESIDDLINSFEVLIDCTDKKGNGMVYTPLAVKRYIIEQTIAAEEIPRVVDPACGCGSFLITAAQQMNKKYQVDIRTIIKEYIEGFDIDRHSIEKTELLFNVLALEEEGGSVGSLECLHLVNSLEELAKEEYKNRYDVVIGNPPYVRAKNIESKIKPSLRNWSVVSGNVDLYIPFYQLACSILSPKGILGFISPNTFLQSVNGRGLRNYLVEKGYRISILDFREAQAFREVTHYTCICIIDKSATTHTVKYALLNGKSSLNDYKFTEYFLGNYRENQEWRFGNSDIDGIIKKIENQPHKLDDYRIRNGLATLCNEVYFFTSVREDDTYFYREYKGEQIPIEKAVCINVIKPNVIRTEIDLERKMEKAIFPYNSDHSILKEDEFRKSYPKAYDFLNRNKERLLQRDKGKAKDYPAWYAYGRTQGMNNQGKKLLIPYMAERGVAVKSKQEDVLFYCGYALFCDDDKMMEILKRVIESDVFWYYIKNTSKPYSKGYMALAKNYIKNFGFPSFSEEQKERLLSVEKGEERERMIAHLYGIS